jgi:DNA-binding beta-propeller fold protein YncE
MERPPRVILVGRDPGDIAFQPDGQRAFVTHVLGTDVGVVDVASGTQVNAINTGPTPRHHAPVLRGVWSPGGPRPLRRDAASHRHSAFQ